MALLRDELYFFCVVQMGILHVKASPAAYTAEKQKRCAFILEKWLDKRTAPGKYAQCGCAVKTQKLSLFLAVIQFDLKLRSLLAKLKIADISTMLYNVCYWYKLLFCLFSWQAHRPPNIHSLSVWQKKKNFGRLKQLAPFWLPWHNFQQLISATGNKVVKNNFKHFKIDFSSISNTIIIFIK